jgi:hypothetical protein
MAMTRAAFVTRLAPPNRRRYSRYVTVGARRISPFSGIAWAHCTKGELPFGTS